VTHFEEPNRWDRGAGAAGERDQATVRDCHTGLARVSG
jgi:hypothetical protein